ncbi:tetratricopeptide repeat protein [Bdellovibrio sp. HCB337]|uniref:tetratricopeptide repeat protein n=1 Tax=Bdellovibrio sp. HCB337 TaxID=3394358 RepID=UPI0039A4B079
MRVVLVIVSSWLLVSCGLLPSQRSQQVLQANPETTDAATIEQQMKGQKYEAALGNIATFQSEYPYSLSLQKVRFLKGNALEELGRWNEAEQTYKAISTISERNQPEISAMALYRLSYVYEALGDDQRVITTLFEAAKYTQYLPVQVVNAEIPSRLAMVYAKENNAKEAQKWLAEADRGLKKTLDTRQEPLTNEWLSQIYYNMGSISTHQLSADNIMTIIHGQAAVQKYLIRALQYTDPIWSAKALAKLKTTYMDLWNAIEGYQAPSGYEPLVAQKMKKDEQVRLAGPFSELLKEAELYRPGTEQKSNQYQSEFFNFLDELQTRVRSILESSFYTPLMPGRDKAPQKPKTPVKIVPSEDPNL